MVAHVRCRYRRRRRVLKAPIGGRAPTRTISAIARAVARRGVSGQAIALVCWPHFRTRGYSIVDGRSFGSIACLVNRLTR